MSDFEFKAMPNYPTFLNLNCQGSSSWKTGMLLFCLIVNCIIDITGINSLVGDIA